ncbi:MerR family transcriptional regulator [Microlunatus sp. GCM10028923]|uniref:MerR family transcriptional regulator n=1 Tax=Microlunatus sp. GCM10028923 TaxID=3273400 RepID=UPI003619900D
MNDETCGVAELEPGTDGPLSIGQVAARTGLSIDTLRWYEREGLLDQVSRDGAGRRQFGTRDLRRLVLLIRLRATGMPVAEMKRYADLMRVGPSTDLDRALLLEAHRDRVAAHIADLQRDLELINRKITSYRGALAVTEA